MRQGKLYFVAEGFESVSPKISGGLSASQLERETEKPQCQRKKRLFMFLAAAPLRSGYALC
jgi:hypothetical protein